MNETDNITKPKISKEIIILGIIVILYSLQGMPVFNFSYYASKFAPLPEKFIFTRFVFSITLRIFLLISGIGILLRKEIFRKSVLLVSFFTICTIYWKHPVLCYKNSFMYNVKQGWISADLIPKIDLISWFCVAASYLIDISISAFLIYLLSRPKIKAQFKGK
ncbi:MAG: hypothetical protein PHU59_01330 [Candidatus Omnitrophica bacterium]|nr:hypothetical protein [Candidatus Omnitrophota bacterium]